MLVTLFGIVIDFNEEQAKNAHSPMFVTPLGIVIDFSEEQTKNAHRPIVVTLLGMIVVRQPVIKVFFAVSIMALQLLRLS